MTRTITAAVLLSLTLSVLPAAAAADDATAIVTDLNIRTLRQAGWSWGCIAQDFPTTTKGRVITVSLMHVGGLVIGVCTPPRQAFVQLTDQNQVLGWAKALALERLEGFGSQADHHLQRFSDQAKPR